jgi:hypothetical protein
MTTKINKYFTTVKLYGTIAVLLLLACSCNTKKTNALQSTVYRTGTGFGYSISVKEKLLIKQDFIPGIQGNTAFCDSLDAVKVSNCVLEKIKQKQMPVVTEDDLAALKIKTKC